LALFGFLPGGPGQVVAFCAGVLLLWFIVPFLFSAHGIFFYRQSVLHSIWRSIRIVRFTLSATSLFFLAVFVISRGLDLLWSIPAGDSWFTLVGILGHAFTSTGLLAASFVFYRDADLWSRQVESRLRQAQSV
jgi:hypothetical protein